METKKQGRLRKVSTAVLAAVLSVSCCPASLAFADPSGNDESPAITQGSDGDGGSLNENGEQLGGSANESGGQQSDNVEPPEGGSTDAAPHEEGAGVSPLAAEEAEPLDSEEPKTEVEQRDLEDGVIAEGTIGGVASSSYKLEKAGDQVTLTFSWTGATFPSGGDNQVWLKPINELPAGTHVKVVIEEGATSVGRYLFDTTGEATWTKDHPIDLVLPSTLTSIAKNGMPRGLVLASITVPSEGCPIADSQFLFDSTAHTKLYKSAIESGDITVPDGVTEIPYNTFPGLRYGTLKLPASVKTLYTESFGDGTVVDSLFDAIEVDPANATFYVEDDATSPNYGCLCKRSDKSLVLRGAIQDTVTDASGVTYSSDYSKLVSVPSSLSGSYTVHEDCTAVLVSAFSSCSQLESLDLANVKSVAGGYSVEGNLTFRDCLALKTVTGMQVEKVDRQLFSELSGLETVSFPNATEIAASAFLDCTALASIDLPEATAIGNFAFEGAGLKTVAFPKVASIGISAFSGCALESVVLPSTLTKLGSTAFAQCNSLESMDISATSLTTLGTSFANCPKLKTAKLPAGLSVIEAGAFENCASLVSLDLTPFPLTTIGRTTNTAKGAFEGCSSLTEVKLPNTVTSVGTGTFAGCASLVTSDLSALSIPQLGVNMYSGCTALTGVTLPDTVTSLPMGAFANCESLTSFVVPSTVTTIASSFTGCTNLASIDIPEGVTSLAGSFADCSSLTAIEVPSTVTNIGANTFAGCTSLGGLSLPESVTAIGAGAFARCSSLTEIALPDAIAEIGAGAFWGSGISHVKAPANLFEDVPAGLFTSELIYGNSAIGRTSPLFISTYDSESEGYTNNTLKSVDLSSYQQTYLPTFMFAGSTTLEEVAIPKTINSIMGGAFMNCAALENVYYYGDPAVVSVYETQKVKHSFGYEYIGAGAFSVPSGTNPETAGPDFAAMEGLSFFGLGISENNVLKEYAEKTNCTYTPFAFLGGGGSSEDAVAKFGYANPDNTVSATDIMSGGTPVFTVGYPFDEGVSRTLAPGEDCTVTYALNGREVADFSKPGTYSATIVGDGKSVWGTATATFTVTASNVGVERLGGSHRYETMALASQAAFPDAGSCPTVVVARGDSFPDALAAAGLAGVEGGQVLLTSSSSLTSDTRIEIERLGATKAYVIGDENAVSAAAFDSISALVDSAERVGGADRYSTAVAIHRAGGSSWGGTAIVATGTKAADSLSASVVAYALKAPIFLAGSDGSLSVEALAAIRSGGFSNVLVLGDRHVVSEATFAALEGATGGAERLGGADRYETSALIAQWALGNGFSCSDTVLAAGRDENFPDALVASSLGGKAMSPLLLVGDGATLCVDEVLAVNKGDVAKAYVLGDKHAVSDALYEAVRKAVS